MPPSISSRVPTSRGISWWWAGRLIRSAGARTRARSESSGMPHRSSAVEDGTLVLRDRRRPLGDLATARTSFPDRAGPNDALSRHWRHLQSDRGTPYRVRAALRAAAHEGHPREARPARDAPNRRARLSPHQRFRLFIRGELRSPVVGIGGRIYSEVSAIEDQPLSAAESGWSAFLLQRDYHDYFEAIGAGAYGWVQPTRPLRLEVSLRRDHERSLRATDPWSLLRNSDRWRRNPLIDDGHFFIDRCRGSPSTRATSGTCRTQAGSCRPDTSMARVTISRR